jgi:hypothetical protein
VVAATEAFTQSNHGFDDLDGEFGGGFTVRGRSGCQGALLPSGARGLRARCRGSWPFARRGNLFVHHILEVQGELNSFLLEGVQQEADIFVCIEDKVMLEEVKAVIKAPHEHYGEDAWVKGHPPSGKDGAK